MAFAKPLLRVSFHHYKGIVSLLSCTARNDDLSDVDSVQEWTRSLLCPFPLVCPALQPEFIGCSWEEWMPGKLAQYHTCHDATA